MLHVGGLNVNRLTAGPNYYIWFFMCLISALNTSC